MSLLTLDIEKAAAGGRMLARHEGRVVLVAGAIPGERVVARLERTERGVAFAEVAEILQPPRTGGLFLAMRVVAETFSRISTYARQLTLKGEIIQDAFRRIGKIPLAGRASGRRLARAGLSDACQAARQAADAIGFFLEGTHHVCDVASTGQLLPETADWIAALSSGLDARADARARSHRDRGEHPGS